MTTQQLPQVPPDFLGTRPEYMVYTELVRQGKVPGVDFIFQSSLFGGRIVRGGLVLDFFFDDPPGLAINVQGEYWHRGAITDARDLMARAQAAGEGITVIFLDEQDVYRDVEFYVREALAFRDHSRLARGG